MAWQSGTSRLSGLRRSRDLIDREFASPLDLDGLAAHAGYSRYHFIRAAYGVTPGDYLSRRRIERACELLRSVNLTVTEVCFLVGFSSLGSFSSRFSELVECSPSAYQRRGRHDGGPPRCRAASRSCGALRQARQCAIAEKPPAVTPQ